MGTSPEQNGSTGGNAWRKPPAGLVVGAVVGFALAGFVGFGLGTSARNAQYFEALAHQPLQVTNATRGFLKPISPNQPWTNLSWPSTFTLSSVSVQADANGNPIFYLMGQNKGTPVVVAYNTQGQLVGTWRVIDPSLLQTAPKPTTPKQSGSQPTNP